MSRVIACLFVLFIAQKKKLLAQQQVIHLYKDVAPGSASWDWDEKSFFVKVPLNDTVLYNIRQPTLTVFKPDTPNGTAVLLIPGGAYRTMMINREGIEVAKELVSKGVTVFLLRHRLIHSVTDNPWAEMEVAMKDSSKRRIEIDSIKPLALADARKGMQYIRQHLSDYQLNAQKIGVMGFSSGGALSLVLAYDYTPDTKPDFAAILYVGIAAGITPTIPADAPPIFIAGATDDTRLRAAHNINLYNLWVNAKKSAELHMYATGDHGLRKGVSSTWIKRFEEWLVIQGFGGP